VCEKSNWREGVNTPSLFPCFYAFIKSKSSISTRSSAAVASCNDSSFLAMVTSGTNCYKSCCVGPVPGTIRVETLLMGRRLLYGVTGFDALQGVGTSELLAGLVGYEIRAIDSSLMFCFGRFRLIFAWWTTEGLNLAGFGVNSRY
jgi:hypothetical protein